MPAELSAGSMAPLINAAIAQVAASSNAVAVGLGGISEVARTCITYYEQVDSDQAANMEEIKKALDS